MLMYNQILLSIEEDNGWQEPFEFQRIRAGKPQLRNFAAICGTLSYRCHAQFAAFMWIF